MAAKLGEIAVKGLETACFVITVSYIHLPESMYCCWKLVSTVKVCVTVAKETQAVC